MSARVVTVRPDATLGEAARLMDHYHVACLPVIDDHAQLVGIITPRDLVRVFLRPDLEIQEEIFDDVLVGQLHTDPSLVSVNVLNGVVSLAGELERRSMLDQVLPLVRAVDGVVGAEACLTYQVDDSTPEHDLAARLDPAGDELPLSRYGGPAARRRFDR